MINIDSLPCYGMDEKVLILQGFSLCGAAFDGRGQKPIKWTRQELPLSNLSIQNAIRSGVLAIALCV